MVTRMKVDESSNGDLVEKETTEEGKEGGSKELGQTDEKSNDVRTSLNWEHIFDFVESFKNRKREMNLSTRI